MVMRCRLSARGLTDRTSPTSVTMPVNMSRTLKYLERVRPKFFDDEADQLPVETVERHALQRLDAVRADGLFSAQQRDLVHQSGGGDGAGNLRPALHHQPGDALLGQYF